MSAYEKFKKLYFSLNVCSLRKSQKIYLCRQNLSRFHSTLKLDPQSYDEDACKTRRRRLDSESNRYERFFVVLCPPAAFIENPRVTSSTMYYLGSTLNPKSMLIFSRLNKKGSTSRPSWYVEHLQTLPMLEDELRKRISNYKNSVELQKRKSSLRKRYDELDTKLNLAESEGRMPTRISEIQEVAMSIRKERGLVRQMEFLSDRWLLDDSVITFSKIKKSRSSTFYLCTYT